MEIYKQLNREKYDKIVVETFDDQIKDINEFRKIVKKHIEKEEERKSGI